MLKAKQEPGKPELEFSSFYCRPEIANDYDRLHDNTLKKQVVRDVEKAFFSTILGKRISGRRILEIGAGTGELTAHLADGNTITAVDISDSMLEVARNKISSPSVQFQILDMFELDSLADTFDIIIASRVFLHLAPDALATMLDRCSKRVRSGGFLLFDIQRPSLWRRALSRVETSKVKNPDYDRQEIERLMESSLSWQLSSITAFDHWPVLFPAAFLSGHPRYTRLRSLLVSAEQALQNSEFGASRWGLVCQRR